MFKEMLEKLSAHFLRLQDEGYKLFTTTMNGDELWNIYISSFTPEDDPVFRDPNSSYHNANADKHFIRSYGNIVALNDNLDVISIFDVPNLPEVYVEPFKKMGNAVKEKPINNPFLVSYHFLNNMTYDRVRKNADTFIGYNSNYKEYSQEEADKFGNVEVGRIYKFNHFRVPLKSKYMVLGSAETHKGEIRSNTQVFMRGLEDIDIDALNLVEELIDQYSLLDGTTHLKSLREFRMYKRIYDKLSNEERELWGWFNAENVSNPKFKNTLLGILCVELSEGKSLNKACEELQTKSVEELIAFLK